MISRENYCFYKRNYLYLNLKLLHFYQNFTYMRRILQFPKKSILEKRKMGLERDDSDEYFDIIRSWIQNSDTPRFYLDDLENKGKIMRGSQTYKNLVQARELDRRLRNLATPGIQSPMGYELVLEAEVKFSKIKVFEFTNLT